MPTTEPTSTVRGEEVASNTSLEAPLTNPITGLRTAAAANELNQLRDDLAARDARIAELTQAIDLLQKPAGRAPVTDRDERPIDAAGESAARPQPARSRGAMSARIGDDASVSAKAIDHAVIHATATGKRRDLLAYLRLRRKRPD